MLAILYTTKPLISWVSPFETPLYLEEIHVQGDEHEDVRGHELGLKKWKRICSSGPIDRTKNHDPDIHFWDRKTTK